MTTLRVRIGAKRDTEPLFPEVDSHPHTASVELVGVLEEGTQNGRTSVSIAVKTSAGEWVIAHTTAALFLAAAESVRGACRRFGDVEGH